MLPDLPPCSCRPFTCCKICAEASHIGRACFSNVQSCLGKVLAVSHSWHNTHKDMRQHSAPCTRSAAHTSPRCAPAGRHHLASTAAWPDARAPPRAGGHGVRGRRRRAPSNAAPRPRPAAGPARRTVIVAAAADQPLVDLAQRQPICHGLRRRGCSLRAPRRAAALRLRPKPLRRRRRVRPPARRAAFLIIPAAAVAVAQQRSIAHRQVPGQDARPVCAGAGMVRAPAAPGECPAAERRARVRRLLHLRRYTRRVPGCLVRTSAALEGEHGKASSSAGVALARPPVRTEQDCTPRLALIDSWTQHATAGR